MPRQRRLDRIGAACNVQRIPRAGQAGVEQLAAGQRSVRRGQDHEDVVELRRVLYGLYAVVRLHNAQEEEGAFALVPDERVGDRRD